MRKNNTTQNLLYCKTWNLLKNYRDVRWSLELSIRQIQNSSAEDLYICYNLSDIHVTDDKIKKKLLYIEQICQTLRSLNTSVRLLGARHKYGDLYYWILYYTFLSPQKLPTVENILEKIQSKSCHLTLHTYYQRRREAIEALSSILWRTVPPANQKILKQFFAENYFAGK